MKRETHRKTKSVESTSKIHPLEGYLEAQMICCGRSNCKCSKGELHGPYYIRRWERRGKKCSKYVKKGELPSVIAGISARKQQREELKEFARSINEASSLLRQYYKHILGIRL
jgi:hypothetical protein